ncbi:MAG: hypothetical protein MK132_15970 [Lentisphaerales bacterium]|nr:hypothetical protein [Lentisphaerales bacterium]
MTKLLAFMAILQLAVIGYFLNSGGEASVLYKNEEVVKVYKEFVEPEEAPKVLEIEKETAEVEKKSYDYFIPERRIISGNGIELDKNINALATLGQVMLENPLMIRAFERLVREQFYHFYSDFIKEADLSPEEQLQLFQYMAEAMQENMKSFMKAIGENMDRMSEFRNGPPLELVQGIRENNLQLKEDLIGSIGEEKFNLFEQYHKEKSAAEDFLRLSQRLERGKIPLDDSQKVELRQIFVEQQVSPFATGTYEQQQDHQSLYDNTEGVLNEKQQESFKSSHKRHKRVYLLPF